MKKVKQFLLGALIFIGGIAASYAGLAYAATHTLQFVETPIVQLFASESFNATSITVTPVPVDLDGNVLTIANFGSKPTFTVDPGISGFEEIEGFTGITNNGNGTETLTGLTRDLVSVYPYTTVGTGRAHAAGATIVFSNNPQMYARFAAPENDNAFTGTQTFSSTTATGFDQDPGATYYTTAGNNVFVDVGQLNRTAIAGASNANASTKGIVQVATALQAASTTALGSTGAFAVLTSSISTSTCQTATTSVLVAQNNGKMAPGCLDLANLFTFTGTQVIGATTSFSNGFVDTASSSVIATTTFLGPLINAGLVTAFTAAETITAGTPVTVTASSTLVFKAISTLASTTQYIGIAKTAATAGQTIYVQTTGVYIGPGLSALTQNDDYYSNDTATISATRGTLEIYVGRALSATSLLIVTDKTGQFNGSATVANNSGNVIVPQYTRAIDVTPMTANGPSGTGGGGTAYLTKDANSATSQSSVCCSLTTYTYTVTWAPPTDIRYVSVIAGLLGGSGPATGGGGTAYFYR